MDKEEVEDSGLLNAENLAGMDYVWAMTTISQVLTAQVPGNNGNSFAEPSQEVLDATNTYLDTQLALLGATARYNAEKAKLNKTDVKGLLELKKKHKMK